MPRGNEQRRTRTLAPSRHQIATAARCSGWIVWYVTAYDPGAAVVVVATVDDSMSFPVHGFPFAGYGTNLPSFTWTNQPQFVGAALPKVAALMSIGWHDRPAPS